MILKVYVEKGFTKNALYVFDNMGKCGQIPSLRSYNSLLNNLVKKGRPTRHIMYIRKLSGLE